MFDNITLLQIRSLFNSILFSSTPLVGLFGTAVLKDKIFSTTDHELLTHDNGLSVSISACVLKRPLKWFTLLLKVHYFLSSRCV